MNTFSIKPSVAPRTSFRAVLLGLGVCVSSVAPLLRAQADTSANKDYIVFVGLNLEVSESGKYLPVIDAENNVVHVDRDHKREKIDLKRAEGIRITRGVKLSTRQAEIADLESEMESRRGKMEALQANLAVQGELQDQMQRQDSGFARADYNGVRRQDNGASTGSAQSSYTAQVPQINQGMSASNVLLDRQIAQIGGVADTYNVSFNLSSPTPIESGYVVLVTDFVVPGKDEAVHYRVATRSLGRIDVKPKHITLSQSGFPAGFEVKAHHVGVFSEGQEVVTNLSDKRVPLSRKDAEQFLLMQYVIAHQGETRVAKAYPMLPQPELRKRVDPSQLPPVVYVDVDKEGAVLGYFGDKTGKQKLTGQAETAMQVVSFYPALEKGAPVAGRATVVVAELLK